MDKYINQLTEKTSLVSADLFPIWDSVALSTKYVQRGNIGIGIWTKETPSGAFDGANVTYTLAHTPLANSLDLNVNGQLYVEGVDYTLSGTTLTLITALPAGYNQAFVAKYQY